VLTIAEKEKKRIELGLPDPKAEAVDTFNHNVITRPMLRLPESKYGDSDRERITIMTYNVLAQSLIRRRLFPTSGTNISNCDTNKLML
jgi:RNA exonuclease NGL2